jgi:hypothetical protein
MMLKQSLKSLLVTIFVILVMPFTGNLQARQSSSWELVLGSFPLKTLYVITQDGVKTHSMPDSLSAARKGYTAQRLSPQGRYLLLGSLGIPSLAPGLIMDLQKHTCCTKVALPPDSDPDDVGGLRLGPFSPDGSQFAAVYSINVGDWATGYSRWVLVTVDAATGKLLTQFTIPRGHRLDHAPVIEGWNGKRVFVRPDCSACEGFLWDRLYMWEPQTGIIGEIPTQASVGDRRGLFGEHIRMEYDANYPALVKDWPKGIRGNSPFHPNTIRYYTDYKDPTPDVWYHDPAHRKIIAARWVMGGQGFLFMATNETNDVRGRCYLGLRNGKIIEA